MQPWKGFGFSVAKVNKADSLIVWKNQPEDLNERRLAVIALYQAMIKRDFPLAGILYWKLTTHDYHLPYEPFALNVALPSRDGLQEALLKFLIH